ncbi:MAG TPA: zf-HC2 domain-containing protein [Methylomirabilota bacterium]|nr:zf-HC2 domain-containing protein [Methylomirabilota bacterium]
MHPESELTGYAADELPAPERARVAAHLHACAECRRVVDESRAVLDRLAAGVPAPPPLDWGRYQVELRARRLIPPRRAWWVRPLPALVVAGAAAAGLLLAVPWLDRARDPATVEETALGARLPLLQQYHVVERLDLLEDLDAIRHLDRLRGAP